MSHAELIEFLRTQNRPQFVSFMAVTVPKLKPTCPFIKVEKHSEINGLICFSYEGVVNRIEGVEDFVAGPRQWGTRIHGTPLVEHKGEYYLEVMVRSREDQFKTDGVPLDAELIRQYIPEKPEVLFRPRDFKISGIREMKVGGVHCIINT